MLFLWYVLRGFSLVYQAVLCGMGILLCLATLVTGSHGFYVPWLPFPQDRQFAYILALGVIGLLFVLLALVGKLRFLLWVFAIHSAYTLIKGLFLSGYTFSGDGEARIALLVVLGALLSTIGTFPASTKARR